MEALKVFLNITGCVFVLAIDFSVVANGVKAKYGKDFEESKARAFLIKLSKSLSIFQLAPTTLPDC